MYSEDALEKQIIDYQGYIFNAILLQLAGLANIYPCMCIEKDNLLTYIYMLKLLRHYI